MNKLKTISVTKLFGEKNNNYKIDLIQDDKITFIYAYNGVGKTTLLRLIDAAIKRKMTVLDSIKFESITMEFASGEIYSVKKLYGKLFDELYMSELPKDISGKYYFPIVFSLLKNKTLLEGKYVFTNAISKEIDNMISEKTDAHFLESKEKKQLFLKDFYKYPILDNDGFLDNREIEDKLLSFGVDLLFANKDYNRFVHTKNVSIKGDDARFNSGISFFENYGKEDVISVSIRQLYNEMIEQREEEISRNLSFINCIPRSSTAKEYEPIPEPFLEKIQGAIKYLSISMPDKVDFIENYLKYFLGKDYINYLISKYPYKNNKELHKVIEQKIKLFESIINDQNELKDKKMNINRDTGVIEIRRNDDPYKVIPAKWLSSGEKNLLLLYFHLIFLLPDDRTENHPFIALIDEPEVSLHPDWLISFIKNLRIINYNVQFIIATHSPAITYGNSHLMVEMKR